MFRQHQAPQKDKSNLGQGLKINRTTYPVGMGVHAPCALMYEIKPDYKRFFALAGADENLVSVSNGSNLAKYPSVVFKVFIDGQAAATNPVGISGSQVGSDGSLRRGAMAARNESVRHRQLNPHIARSCRAASEPQATKRTWAGPLEELAKATTDVVTVRDKPLFTP